MSSKVPRVGGTGPSEHEREIAPAGKTSDEVEVGPEGQPVGRNYRPFIKGPLDWGWLVRAYDAGRSSLLVALDIMRKAGMARRGDWIVANATSLSTCLSRSCYNRSLTRLEEAGLIVVDRKRGAAVRVKLIESL